MIRKVVGLVIGLALSATATLRAGELSWLNYCTTGSLRTCASVQITTTISGSTTNISVRVKNLQGTTNFTNLPAYGIASVWFDVSPDAFDGGLNPYVLEGDNLQSVAGSVNLVSTAAEWHQHVIDKSNPLSGGFSFDRYLMHGGAIIGCDAPDALLNTAGAIQTCDDWVTFNFTTNFAWDVAQLGNVEMNYQAVFADGTGDVCTTGLNCSVVPEPITMVLLGSGLLGVGGAAYRKRRRFRLGKE